MRGRLGILDLIGLAATLIFAIPVGIYGVQVMLDGRTVFGAALVVVAALMVILPQVVPMPQDVPGSVAQKIVGTAVSEPDDEEKPSE